MCPQKLGNMSVAVRGLCAKLDVTSLAPFLGARIGWLVEKVSAALQGGRR